MSEIIYEVIVNEPIINLKRHVQYVIIGIAEDLTIYLQSGATGFDLAF